jgi:hypothetical protein
LRGVVPEHRHGFHVRPGTVIFGRRRRVTGVNTRILARSVERTGSFEESATTENSGSAAENRFPGGSENTADFIGCASGIIAESGEITDFIPATSGICAGVDCVIDQAVLHCHTVRFRGGFRHVIGQYRNGFSNIVACSGNPGE